MNFRTQSFWHHLRQSFGLSLVLMILCGLMFPLVLSGIGGVLFPSQAGGNLIEANHQIIGAQNVGQEFTQDYFLWGRPSTYHYNVYKEDVGGKKVYSDGETFAGLASGSQNLAPSNPDLANRVVRDRNYFLAKNPSVKPEEIPTDLLTASGSGLDPHISVQAAVIQVPRIAKASGLNPSQIKQIIKKNTNGKTLGIFGEETVNVLLVNQELAKMMK